MKVTDVAKAFGAIFIDVEGLKTIGSVAYRKKGYVYVYLKENNSGEDLTEEVQKEINEVFGVLLRLNRDDIQLKDRRVNEYRFTLLNEKNVRKGFNRVNRAFKRKSEN